MNNTPKDSLPAAIEARKQYLETKIKLLEHQIEGDVKGLKNSLAPDTILKDATRKYLFPHLSADEWATGNEQSAWAERGIAAAISLMLTQMFPKRIRGFMSVVAPIVAAATAPMIRRRLTAIIEKTVKTKAENEEKPREEQDDSQINP